MASMPTTARCSICWGTRASLCWAPTTKRYESDIQTYTNRLLGKINVFDFDLTRVAKPDLATPRMTMRSSQESVCRRSGDLASAGAARGDHRGPHVSW